MWAYRLGHHRGRARLLVSCIDLARQLGLVLPPALAASAKALKVGLQQFVRCFALVVADGIAARRLPSTGDLAWEKPVRRIPTGVSSPRSSAWCEIRLPELGDQG